MFILEDNVVNLSLLQFNKTFAVEKYCIFVAFCVFLSIAKQSIFYDNFNQAYQFDFFNYFIVFLKFIDQQLLSI